MHSISPNSATHSLYTPLEAPLPIPNSIYRSKKPVGLNGPREAANKLTDTRLKLKKHYAHRVAPTRVYELLSSPRALQTYINDPSFRKLIDSIAAQQLIKKDCSKDIKPFFPAYMQEKMPHFAEPCKLAPQTRHILLAAYQAIEPNYEDYCRAQISELFLSKEAVLAYESNPLFQALIDKMASKEVIRGDCFKIIKLVLSIDTKKPKITRQDLIHIRLLHLETLPAAADLDTLLHAPLNEEYGVFIIQNLVLLLTQKQDPHIEAFLKISPTKVKYGLVWACVGSDAFTMEYMLESNMFQAYKYKIDEVNLMRLTAYPMHWAAYFGKKDWLVKFILASMELNELDEQGKSPLHYAIQEGNIEIVEFLIQHGAVKDLQDSHGKTPARLAFEKNHGPLFEILFDASCFNPWHNPKDCALLQKAKKCGHSNIVRILRRTVEARFPRSLSWLGTFFSWFLTWRPIF